MQYDDFDEGPTWGVRSPRDGEGDLGLVKDTMKKEQVIKSVFSTSQMFLLWFYLLDQGDLGFTRGSQGYAFTTYELNLSWFEYDCNNSYVSQSTNSAKGGR
jgi:hypothetical protein